MGRGGRLDPSLLTRGVELKPRENDLKVEERENSVRLMERVDIVDAGEWTRIVNT